MVLWYTGGIRYFFTLWPAENLPQPSNRTLPWTWGLIVQRCSPSWASARSACRCGSGSWSHPRCGSGSSCPPRCGSGSSVRPRRWHWSQKPCGTSSAWSCWQRALQEELSLTSRQGRKPSPSSWLNHACRSLHGWTDSFHMHKNLPCSGHVIKNKLLQWN